MPQAVTAPQPVLGRITGTAGDVGVEPRRNAHHVGFATQDRLPCGIDGEGHWVRAVWPDVPRQGAIHVGEGAGRSFGAGPVGDEKAAGGGLDPRPVCRVGNTFEGRCQWGAVIQKVRSLRLVCVDVGDDALAREGVCCIVEGNEQREVFLGVCGCKGIVELCGGIGIAADIQGKAIDTGSGSELDVGSPVSLCPTVRVANLIRLRLAR